MLFGIKENRAEVLTFWKLQSNVTQTFLEISQQRQHFGQNAVLIKVMLFQSKEYTWLSLKTNTITVI